MGGTTAAATVEHLFVMFLDASAAPLTEFPSPPPPPLHLQDTVRLFLALEIFAGKPKEFVNNAESLFNLSQG